MNRPGGVFISYRRQSGAAARALHERLHREFADREIFLNIDAIAAGIDFVETIARRLESCAAVVVLIDPGWIGAHDAQGHRRLDDDSDLVRAELRAAFERGIRVIPVLLDGASMPRAEQLPDDLKPLVRRHAVTLDFDTFDADVSFVVKAVRAAMKASDEPEASDAEPALRRSTGSMNAIEPGPDGATITGSAGPAPGPAPAERRARAARPPPPPRPPLRAALRALLRPHPGDMRYTLLGRRAYWIGLACLFAAGVAAPYLLPGPMRAMRGAAAAPSEATQALTPGTRFRDCGDETCPWLVVLPEGSFTMGSPAGEEGRFDDEGPQRRVTIGRRLAVMETEVTRAQFEAFVNETGYRSEGGCFTVKADGSGGELNNEADWRNPRFSGFTQTGDHPAVCISWYDGQAFAAWMSRRTKQTYRLLSEAEWEYAARAGSPTRYSFGDSERELCRYANVADRTAKERFSGWTTADCVDRALYTAPVRRYQPNRWGLYDMHGNAWEWVQDCGHSYEGAPSDGTPVEAGLPSDPAAREARPQQGPSADGPSDAKDGSKPCSRRLLRGGAWFSVPGDARSAIRIHVDPASRFDNAGLRLTRMLPF